MFQKLVSHNEDLHRLVEKGYAVAFDSGCLVIRDIPYLDSARKLCLGAFVTKMESVNEDGVVQQNHQVSFAGGTPYGLDGKPIPNLGENPHTLALTSECGDVVVERIFSNKPKGKDGFIDFFEKIESYATIIAGPATDLHGVSPLTFKTVEDDAPPSVFKFRDALTNRAEIAELSAKFEEEVVAVIGLGGTGSYVLDFLVKTPVKEVRGYDLDRFHVHNSFRSPGRLLEEELGKSKAEVLLDRYDSFRTGLSIEASYIDGSSEGFDDVTFAFVCVDKGASRAGIFELLLKKGIPFIDVGMGLNRKNGSLNGMARATYYSPENSERQLAMGHADLKADPNDLYRTNIQIAELNALNACLAVLKFKQLRGFYHEDASPSHLLFGIDDLKIVGEQ